MNNRGDLWIIPNEEDIILDVYTRRVPLGMSHTYYLQEFSDLYNLGFNFKEDDCQIAPCEMASIGHLVIKSENQVSMVVCYLPEIITYRQFQWFHQNMMMLSNYTQVNGFSLQMSDSDGICFKKLHGVNEIMTEMRKKYSFKVKGMRKNVG